MRLEPLQLWFRPAQGPLLNQLRPALAAAAQGQAGPEARLLRWAITASEPGRGLRIEAVMLVGDRVGPSAGLGTGLGQLALDPPQANRRPQGAADGWQLPGVVVAKTTSHGLAPSGATPDQDAPGSEGS